MRMQECSAAVLPDMLTTAKTDSGLVRSNTARQEVRNYRKTASEQPRGDVRLVHQQIRNQEPDRRRTPKTESKAKWPLDPSRISCNLSSSSSSPAPSHWVLAYPITLITLCELHLLHFAMRCMLFFASTPRTGVLSKGGKGCFSNLANAVLPKATIARARLMMNVRRRPQYSLLQSCARGS